MSKAFTREDVPALEPDDEPEEPVPASAGPRYITREGFRRLELELQGLWQNERPKVTREVADAAALGDRSENAEYIYGKRRLREIDRRIRFLSKLLDRLVVVLPDPAQAGRVFFGAHVTVEDEDGRQSTYKIVGPDETDLSSGKISVESPVARALIGRQVGEDATVQRPKGAAELRVIAIGYDEVET